MEQTSSHFDRRALLWALGDQLPEGAAAPTHRCRRSGSRQRPIVCVHEADGPLDFDHYTTPRLAAIEQRFIDAALEGTDAGVAAGIPPTLAAVLDRHAYLGDDQRELVIRLTTGGERVVPVAALPGTGKTTALEAAREAWEAAGIPVIGCATAATASGELKDAGFTTATRSASSPSHRPPPRRRDHALRARDRDRRGRGEHDFDAGP